MFLIVKEIQVIHCTCSKVIDEKHRRAVCSAVSGYFAVNIPFFFSCHKCIPFCVFDGSGSGSEPNRFDGSGSGSDQNVSAPAAPAPALAPHP